MAYEEALAARIRQIVAADPQLTEKRMFGGLAFLIGGNMAISASGQGGLLVRINPDESDKVLRTTAAVEMVMRGRPMAGWVRVASVHVQTTRALAKWVTMGVEYARSLPPKR